MREQIVCAAIELAGAHDIFASAGDTLYGIGDCCHTRGNGNRPYPTLHLRYTPLQDRARGIHDARIDIALDLQVEQVSAMLGIIKRIGSGLINGDCGRLGGGFGLITVVQGQRFQFHSVLLAQVRSVSRGLTVE